MKGRTMKLIELSSRNTYHEKYLETWGWDYGI